MVTYPQLQKEESFHDKRRCTWFIKKIQDNGFFNLKLSTVENDIYYISLADQIKNLIEDIYDNQTLIEKLDSKESLWNVFACINNEVSEQINSAFKNTPGALEQEELVKAYQDTMRQMALAI